MAQPLQIDIRHDVDAGVWIAASVDVPGLATEAATLLALDDRLQQLVPELVDINGGKVRQPLRWNYVLAAKPLRLP